MEADCQRDFLIIGITPQKPVEQEWTWITELLRDGVVDIMHIRHPEADADEMKRIIAGVPEDLRYRLTLHDRFELAIPLGIGGIHLNRRNPQPPPDARAITPGLRISKSCHSIEEVEESAGLTYVTLSPIFDSISKEGYRALLPQEKLPSLRKRLEASGVAVVALGGITPDKENLLRQSGFAGMAMLGALPTPRNHCSPESVIK